MGILRTIGTAVLATTLLGGGIIGTQYADWPFPFTKNTERGRTKNAIATIIPGIVAHDAYYTATIDLEAKKKCWPDTHVVGATDIWAISTAADLFSTSATFTAQYTPLLQGTVDKSEIDWSVEQRGEHTYLVHRFGWKFNHLLTLDVKDGRITGRYERGPMSWNWKIDGTYAGDGNVAIHVDVPWGLDLDLEGRITPK